MNWINNVIAYLQGNWRYKLFYNNTFGWLIRDHIRKQINFRLVMMNSVCYKQGSCVRCGCTTTALQMANKACDKPCYPPLMSKLNWLKFSNKFVVSINGDNWELCKGDRKNPDQYTIFKNGMIVNVHQYAGKQF